MFSASNLYGVPLHTMCKSYSGSPEVSDTTSFTGIFEFALANFKGTHKTHKKIYEQIHASTQAHQQTRTHAHTTHTYTPTLTLSLSPSFSLAPSLIRTHPTPAHIYAHTHKHSCAQAHTHLHAFTEFQRHTNKSVVPFNLLMCFHTFPPFHSRAPSHSLHT